MVSAVSPTGDGAEAAVHSGTDTGDPVQDDGDQTDQPDGAVLAGGAAKSVDPAATAKAGTASESIHCWTD